METWLDDVVIVGWMLAAGALVAWVAGKYWKH